MRLRDWLLFLRVPNAVTAAVDVLAGALVAGVPWSGSLAVQAAGSALLYCGGIALNDVADAPRDAREHPARAIPRGLLSRASGLRAAILLLALGVLPAAFVAGRLPIVLLVLAGIITYDILPEAFPRCQALMLGVVRACNLLSGAVLAEGPVGQKLAAASAGYGILILVLTLASQREGTGKSVRMHGRFLFWAFLVPYALWLNPDSVGDHLPEFGVTFLLAAFPLFTAWRIDSSPAELVRTTLRLLIPWMALLLWCSGHARDALIVAGFAGLQLAAGHFLKFRTS